MKKLTKRILYAAGIITALILIIYSSPYRYLLKGIRLTYLKGKNSANFYDKQDFDLRKVDNGNLVLNIPKSAYYNKSELTSELKEMLSKTNTGSFLILRNDSIIAEHYFNGQ
jgi:hypothetical protein